MSAVSQGVAVKNVPFRIGDEAPELPPAPVDVLAKLRTELKDSRNWAARLPPRGESFVTVREITPPAGDLLLVYHRVSIQFDREHGKIRWDGHAPLDAELKLVEPGAALFLVR